MATQSETHFSGTKSEILSALIASAVSHSDLGLIVRHMEQLEDVRWILSLESGSIEWVRIDPETPTFDDPIVP